MAEKNILEILINQLGNIVSNLQNPSLTFKTPLSPEITQEIDRLEKQITLFNEQSKQSFDRAGVNIEALKREVMHSSITSPKSKKILERADQIQKEAQRLQQQLLLHLSQAKKSSKAPDSKEKQAKNLKKKFKPLGGSKGWIPL